ncbi:hypothetical protein [Psychroflexus planctonicus]|uniref:Uncharacterized protein n=1 Tax=Psychroflexus planctonicus TaxID=1526575 RepID=A0ABQ1SFB4_9FLAO|nr:hypothetical protein [Psychroflexus planctonicus]GGE29770.1 hypothetical protein GCM10010832_07850 [Psychroflexus planctonicus]
MNSPKLVDIKKALQHCSREQLIEITTRLAKHKVENKELLHYLLFDAENETLFVEQVKNYISSEFEEINTKNYYWMRKSIRKTLKNVKKYIRFSKSKSTEIELLLHFLAQMLQLKPSILKDKRLCNLYERTLLFVDKKISGVHEDLQYDYQEQRELL